MSSMRASDYAPAERLDAEPTGPDVPPQQREEALWDALRGVELGDFDELTIGWLARNIGNPWLRAVVSLFQRARGIGVVDTYDDEPFAAHLAHPTIGENERRPERSSWVAGNSGPGF
jgi:hypothetical protein